MRGNDTDTATTPAPLRPTRRRMLTILGATLAVPAGVLALRGLGGAPDPVRWDGEVLGATAAMTLWHPRPEMARQTILRMGLEIERLEQVFSLYRPESEIARLNRDGRLDRPSADLVEVLEQALAFAEASGGAFDPAVQPLWTLHAAHFARAEADPAGPGAAEVARARALSDFRGIEVGRRGIAFARPGMAVTLNAIAQGHITDRIADLLRQEGFEQAMVELGETRAIGHAPDGAPFRVALMNPADPGLADREVTLQDASLSVSGGYGMRWPGGNSHHIFDPATGHSANRLLDVAVIAPRARDADALSTAIFVAGEAAAPALLRQNPGASALLTRMDGSRLSL